MVLSKKEIQSETCSLTWDRKLPLEKKIAFLESYFNSSLDKVNFWDLYRTIKKFNH